MNQEKIGKYIASKRKNIGLTQKQLADRLGMSDKSVSKWERGICLPDVSVYTDLCQILDISINEFFAGEDLSEDNMIKEAEHNIIQIAKDSTHKQKRLKNIIRILIVVSLAAFITLGYIAFNYLNQPINYVEAFDPNGTEMRIASLLSDTSSTFMFNYAYDENCENIYFYVTSYHDGKAISKEKVMEIPNGDNKESTLTIIPDSKDKIVKLIHQNSSIKFSTSFTILKNIKDKDIYGSVGMPLQGKVAVELNKEQNILALSYGKDYVSEITDLMFNNGKFKAGKNEYIYVISMVFK